MASWNRRPRRDLLDTSFFFRLGVGGLGLLRPWPPGHLLFFPVRGLGGLGLLISCRLGGRMAERGLRPPDLVALAS